MRFACKRADRCRAQCRSYINLGLWALVKGQLATQGLDGFPSNRTIGLAGFVGNIGQPRLEQEADLPVLGTRFGSLKLTELEQNDRAEYCWQVRQSEVI